MLSTEERTWERTRWRTILLLRSRRQLGSLSFTVSQPRKPCTLEQMEKMRRSGRNCGLFLQQLRVTKKNSMDQGKRYIRTQPISESNTARVKAANIPQQIERLTVHKCHHSWDNEIAIKDLALLTPFSPETCHPLHTNGLQHDIKQFNINHKLTPQTNPDFPQSFRSSIHASLIPTARLCASNSSTFANCITAPPTFRKPCGVKLDEVMCFVKDPRFTPLYCFAYP